MKRKNVPEPPFFEIGPKSYLYGDDVLELALAAERASEKYDVDIIFTTPYTDIRLSLIHILIRGSLFKAREAVEVLTLAIMAMSFNVTIVCLLFHGFITAAAAVYLKIGKPKIFINTS